MEKSPEYYRLEELWPLPEIPKRQALIVEDDLAIRELVEVTIHGVSRKVTQIAFPENVNNAVHGSGAYASRGTNPLSNRADGIFADSLDSELVTPTGDPTNGYTAAFTIGVGLQRRVPVPRFGFRTFPPRFRLDV